MSMRRDRLDVASRLLIVNVDLYMGQGSLSVRRYPISWEQSKNTAPVAYPQTSLLSDVDCCNIVRPHTREWVTRYSLARDQATHEWRAELLTCESGSSHACHLCQLGVDDLVGLLQNGDQLLSLPSVSGRKECVRRAGQVATARPPWDKHTHGYRHMANNSSLQNDHYTGIN